MEAARLGGLLPRQLVVGAPAGAHNALPEAEIFPGGPGVRRSSVSTVSIEYEENINFEAFKIVFRNMRAILDAALSHSLQKRHLRQCVQ